LVSISILRLAKMANPESGNDDAAVLTAWESFHGSYNADAAFQHLLGGACAIARFRPHLLDRLLPRPIDAAVCMGVDNLEQLWQYAEYCVERALEYTGPITPDFSEETAAFFRQDLRQYESLVSRLLQERLAMPND
jgi:hypothetical protein